MKSHLYDSLGIYLCFYLIRLRRADLVIYQSVYRINSKVTIVFGGTDVRRVSEVAKLRKELGMVQLWLRAWVYNRSRVVGWVQHYPMKCSAQAACYEPRENSTFNEVFLIPFPFHWELQDAMYPCYRSGEIVPLNRPQSAWISSQLTDYCEERPISRLI